MENDETINNNEQETTEEVVEKKPVRQELRNRDLSEKVEQTAKERDEAKAEAERAKKDAEFYKGFSKVSSKYNSASDYEDKIKEKVDAGYDLEDAAISVLAKAGKLNAPQAQRESPMGGSAANAMRQEGDKPIGEMSTAEKREALMQIETESPGELTQILKRTNL